MSLMSRGETWVNQKLNASAGKTATYSRNSDSVELTVVPGDTRFEDFGTEGITLQSRVRDFTFEAAGLVLNSVTVLPARGDRITVGSAVHEVLPIGDGELWRYSDRSKLRLRVHTKEVAT